jgi:hypothetical protein
MTIGNKYFPTLTDLPRHTFWYKHNWSCMKILKAVAGL